MFVTVFWTNPGLLFGEFRGQLSGKIRFEKLIFFFERLLEAPWGYLGSLLGCLEALLGALVFQET